MVAGNHTFQGISQAEAQDREDEIRTGVPVLGSGLTLLIAAPHKSTAGVHVQNVGDIGVQVRLRHQGATKTRTNEPLTARAASATRYVGALQHKSIVPGTVSITNAGAPLTIVDTGGLGLLFDTGTTTQRGTIDYATGLVDITYGAAPTEPVRATYQHTDYTDFASPTQTSTKAAAAYTFTQQLGFGRVNPGSIALTDGALTFADDGKGTMLETTGGISVARGTVDYSTGLITLTGGTAPLGGTVTTTYTFNPFGSRIASGGAARLLDLYGGGIPELTAEPYADGVSGETDVGLFGEATEASALGSALTTKWMHFGEGSAYRALGSASTFPPGGAFAIAGRANG